MAGTITGTIAGVEKQQKVPPPKLRQELNLFPAEPNEDGSPAWVLHDPLANRHFRLGQLEVDLLMLCGQGDEKKIAQLATIKMGYEVEPEQVEALFSFLRLNNLVVADVAQHNWYNSQYQLMTKRPWIELLAKSYLFFRIPIWRADNFLNKTLKYVKWLGSPISFIVLSVLFLFGAFFTLRQLNSFISTFLHFFNVEGFSIYLLALGFIKVLHELGHAYTAKNMGCKVPVIGVAFLVGFPILYTDTSDAWKLKSRRKRMNIGIAGIGVELSVAIIALFLWSLIPDGVFRSVLFLLATTTWVMSIFVNFNPLMRFDGYYLLSDWLRVPNLEMRSRDMAKWWMREKLFGLNIPPPEPIQLKLVFFAFSVWIYRFFLFLGIALLVYYFFFKVLGIILFVVEIMYFIVRPIMSELKDWHGFRTQLTWNKATIRSSIILALLIGLFFIPWRSSIEAAAFIKAQYTPLYAPVSGKIIRIAVKNRQTVNIDDLLLEIEAPELTYEKEQGERRYEELSWQRAFLGFDSKMRNEALIVASALFTQNRRLRGLIEKHNKRLLKAPNIGMIADLDVEYRVGDWIAEGTPILSIVNTKDLTVHAYLEEQYLSRIEVGQSGLFYPEAGNYPVLDVKIEDIEGMAVRSMDALYSASTFGGDVAVRENDEKELVPVISVYKIRLKILGENPNLQRVMRGTVVLKGHPESFFKRVKNRFYAVFRREGGF